jgi:hypothetical protein
VAYTGSWAGQGCTRFLIGPLARPFQFLGSMNCTMWADRQSFQEAHRLSTISRRRSALRPRQVVIVGRCHKRHMDVESPGWNILNHANIL